MKLSGTVGLIVMLSVFLSGAIMLTWYLWKSHRSDDKRLLSALRSKQTCLETLTTLSRRRCSPEIQSEVWRLIGDSNPRVQEEALTVALSFRHRYPDSYLNDLLPALSSPVVEVRKAAAALLVNCARPDSVSVATRLLRDSDPSIRTNAIHALFNVESSAALQFSEDLKRDTDPEVRKAFHAYERRFRR